MELAEHFFNKMEERDKVECITLSFKFASQIMSGYGISEPYYLVLDNDVINALEKPHLYKIRYVALISLFRCLATLPEDYRILINPVIFYEFNNEKAFQNKEFFNNGWKHVFRAVSQTGLSIHSVGLNDFKEAKKNFNRFNRDIRAIKSAITKINNIDWEVNLKSNFGGLIFPHYIANQMCPKIKVKYFSSHHTRLFLLSLIENKIVNHRYNDPGARKLMFPDTINKSKLIQIKKDKMKGMGDLALLSQCDIGSQFHSNYKMTFIGITFDKTLAKVLQDHSRIIIEGQRIIGGQETSESIRLKLENNFKQCIELNKNTKKTNEYFDDLISSICKVKWYKNTFKNK